MRSRWYVACAVISFLVVPSLGLAQAKADPKAAKAKYDQLCVGCHGVTGKGDGPAASSLKPGPEDFSDCKHMANYSDDFLFKIIKEGGAAVKKSAMMPPWGASLSDQDLRNMVAYVKSFCKK